MKLIFTDHAREFIHSRERSIQVLPIVVGCTHCGTVHVPQVMLGQPRPDAMNAYVVEHYDHIVAYLHRELETGVWRVEIAGWGRWKSLFLEKAEG